MAILDRVYSLKQRPTYELLINGVPIESWTSVDGKPVRVLALRGGTHHDPEARIATPPYLEIDVTRIPTNMTRGMKVVLRAGYDGEHELVFTGGVYARGDEDPDALRTQEIGTGATDADGDRLESTASIISTPPVYPPIPSGQYIDAGIDNHLAHTQAKLEEMVAREGSRKARIPSRPNQSKRRRTIFCKSDSFGLFRDFKIPARDLSGETVKDSLEGIFADSGVASYNVSVGSFTLAAEGATLDRMNGASMARYLLELQGAFAKQLPSELLIARVITEQPAATASFQYSNTDQQYARIVSTDGGEPLLRVPFNPLLQIWQTIGLELDYLGIDGRYFLQGHEWEISEGGAWSYLDLRGGDEFGASLGFNPVASFEYSVATQVIGTELYYVVTFTDTSTDPDGSLVEASSTWSDNQTTTPEITTFNGKKVATVRIAVASVSGDWTVTRTVTDNDGLTDSVTVTLDLSAASSAVTVPPFGVAAGTRRMVTPDGGQTFNDTTPASDATAFGARLADGTNTGHYLSGHADGSAYVSRDFGLTWTLALAAVGSQINDIVWDWRDHNLAWAITENAKVYLSNDAGASFFLYADLRATTFHTALGDVTMAGALGDLIGLPAGGGVHAFGGDGAGNPYHVYNTNLLAPSWNRIIFTGDLATDTPADATMRIKAYRAPGYDGEDMILAWASGGGASLVAIYHTDDPIGLIRSFSRATGLTAGLKNGRVIMESGPLSPVGAIAMFGDRDTWQRPVGSNVYTKVAANALPAGFTPNHGLYGSSVLTPLSLVYEHIIAVEDATGTGGVMKSTDEGLTWNFLRGPSTLVSWVAGAKAKKVAIGAPASVQTGSDALYVQQSSNQATASSYERRVAQLAAGDVVWSLNANPAGASQAGVTKLRRFNGVLFRIVANVLSEGSSSNVAGQLQRSTDDGANWSNVGPTPVGPIGGIYWGITDIKQGADGALWAVACVAPGPSGDAGFSSPTLYKSEDDGATWTSKYTDSTKDSSQWRRFIAVAPHPSNAAIVTIVGDRGLRAITTWHSTDATASSPTFTAHTGFNTSTSDEVRAAMLSNGRLVALLGTGGTPRRSDDYGVSWTVGSALFTNRQYSLINAGDALFTTGGALGGEQKLYRSVDFALTWVEVLDDTAMVGGVSGFYGLGYSIATGKLYLATNTDTATERVFAIANPLTASAPFSPDDVTYNLDSLISGASDAIGMDCLAVSS